MKPTATKALDEFARRRTWEMKRGQSVQGVTGPGQIRYIHYLEAYIYHNIDIFTDNWMLLNAITVLKVSEAMMPNKSLSFVIECNNEIQYDYGKIHGLESFAEGHAKQFHFNVSQVALRGDVRLRFFLFDLKDDVPLDTQSHSASTRPTRVRGVLGPGAVSLQYGHIQGQSWFFIAFHTAFLEEGSTTLLKQEIDGVYNLPEKTYPRDFGVELDVCQDPPETNLPAELMRRGSQSKSPRGDRSQASSGVASQVRSPSDARLSSDFGTQLSKAMHNVSMFPLLISSKIQPSVRHLAMIVKAREILNRLSPIVETYSQGEPISVDTDDYARTVLIVSHGEVLESHGCTTDDVNSDTTDSESLASSLQTAIYGKHAIFGMIEFMLGPTNVPATITPLSLDVQCQRISISTDFPFAPLQIPGTEPSESGIVYSYLAQEMLSKVRSIRATLARAASVNNAKKDIKIGSSTLNETKILNQITSRFGVPMTEQLLYTGYAVLMRADSNVFCQGRFCLFSSWIVFLSKRAFARVGQDVLISLRNVASASRNGKQISIVVKRDDNEPSVGVGRARARFSSSSAQGPRPYNGGVDRSSLCRRLAVRVSSTFSSMLVSPDDDAVDRFPASLNPFNKTLRMAESRGAPSLHRVLGMGSTDQESFEFPDEDLAQLVCSMLTAKLKDANYEAQTESAEWENTKLNTFQYEKSKFGYFLPGENESESEFMQQLLSVSSPQTFKPGETAYTRLPHTCASLCACERYFRYILTHIFSLSLSLSLSLLPPAPPALSQGIPCSGATQTRGCFSTLSQAVPSPHSRLLSLTPPPLRLCGHAFPPSLSFSRIPPHPPSLSLAEAPFPHHRR